MQSQCSAILCEVMTMQFMLSNVNVNCSALKHAAQCQSTHFAAMQYPERSKVGIVKSFYSVNFIPLSLPNVLPSPSRLHKFEQKGGGSLLCLPDDRSQHSRGSASESWPSAVQKQCAKKKPFLFLQIFNYIFFWAIFSLRYLSFPF